MLVEQCPLLTAVVLHYNNGDVIYETIDSILEQDYPRIELIVSDDGSESFDVSSIERYIEARKGANIESTLVRKNNMNMGTVGHLEQLRMHAKGEIELLIAADDCWRDKGVFSAFADAFEEFGPEAEFITSQIEMCDENLCKVESLFVTPSVRQMLINGDMQSLRDLETYSCSLPGPGSAFRRSYFEKIGSLSKDYVIVEDWTAHLRWLMMGGRIHYLDRVTLKHRHGGVSHSAGSDWPSHYLPYRRDIEKAFRLEIEPYRHLVSPAAFEKAEKMHRFNEALVRSLESTVSVLVPLSGNRSADAGVLDSVLRQNNMNFEIIIGCACDQVEWVIEKTNDSYTQSPRIRRIRLVAGCSDDAEACHRQLEEQARGDYLLPIPSGKKLCSSYSSLDFVYSSKTGKRLDDSAASFVVPLESGEKTRDDVLKGGVKARVKKALKSKGLVNFTQTVKIQQSLLMSALLLFGLVILDLSTVSFAGELGVLLVAVLCVEAALLVLRCCFSVARKCL